MGQSKCNDHPHYDCSDTGCGQVKADFQHIDSAQHETGVDKHEEIAKGCLAHILAKSILRNISSTEMKTTGLYSKNNLIISQESSMIHSASPQFRPAVFAIDFEALGRPDDLCENSDHYRPGLWSWVHKK